MLMPASAEFSALCQSQIAIMAQAIDADSTAVYLAESWNEHAPPKLIPVAAYPPISNTAVSKSESSTSAKVLPEKSTQSSGNGAIQSLQSTETFKEIHKEQGTEQLLLPYSEVFPSEKVASQQLAIPLVHEGGVIGILVSRRAERPWQPNERHQMEECAHALALACVLDQRGQWLQTQLSALNRLQTQQSDRFHELLHQLRNPLTTLKTFGRLLVKRLAPEDKNQSLVLNMLREGDRMQHILGYFDDTLQAADQTRNQTSKTLPLLTPADESDTTLETQASPVKANSLFHFGGDLTLEPCYLSALVMPLIESTKTLAEASSMTFHVFQARCESMVKADPDALIEIISNFLENSLKYSSPGTHIWLQWGLSHDCYSHLEGILVGDTGPGIPKEDQPHIFERHYRGVQTSSSISGSGLGLAIVHDLVQEMEGLINLYSPLSEMPWPMQNKLQEFPKNTGTAFVIWLPKAGK